MGKLIKSMIAAFAATLGVFLIVVLFGNIGTKTANKAAVVPVEGKDKYANLDEEDSVIFYSLGDYVAYLCSIAENGAEVKYRYPDYLPAGVSLHSIKLCKEGVIYYFDIDRETTPILVDPVNRDELNIIHMSNTDYALNSLLHMSVSKFYYNDEYCFISNTRDYAENLADDIGATLDSSYPNVDYYSGNIYVDCPPMNNLLNLVGSQLVVWKSDPYDGFNIHYAYVPSSIQEDERAIFVDMPIQTIINNSDQ